MQVILLEKIRRLGGLGDKVKVKPGFGRNYLLPQGKAVSATQDNIKKFETQRADFEKRANDTLHAAQTRATQITELGNVTITAKVIDENKLYGSVGIIDISEALHKAGVPISKSEIKLPTGPIRLIGEYDIPLYLHSDVVVSVKLNVVPEKQ